MRFQFTRSLQISIYVLLHEISIYSFSSDFNLPFSFDISIYLFCFFNLISSKTCKLKSHRIKILRYLKWEKNHLEIIIFYCIPLKRKIVNWKFSRASREKAGPPATLKWVSIADALTPFLPQLCTRTFIIMEIGENLWSKLIVSMVRLSGIGSGWLVSNSNIARSHNPHAIEQDYPNRRHLISRNGLANRRLFLRCLIPAYQRAICFKVAPVRYVYKQLREL